MKNRYYIIFLLFFLMHPVSVQATAMAPDIIYINGEKWNLLERPIKADPALHARLNEFLPKSHRVINTANFDGYTGYWILKENQLYLQKIEVEMVNEKTGEIYMRKYSAEALKNTFAPHYTQYGIYAQWFTGEIRAGKGRVVKFENWGFNRNYEEEYVMNIKNGEVARMDRKKELSQKELEELSFLKEWNLVIVDYFVKVKHETFLEQCYPIITEAFDNKNLRGLRMAYSDNNDMARDLLPSDLNELNQILREKFGYDLDKVNDMNLAKIKLIIKRGHIKTDDEFRLLLNRVEEIYADDNMKDEVEVLNKLMGDYETNKNTDIE